MSYETVTNEIIKQLESGCAPWVRPWNAGSDRNLISGSEYRGVNRLILGMTSMSRGYGSNVWGTYKQINECGGIVRKGEKGTAIVFFKPVTKSTQNDQGDTEVSSFAVMKSFVVFNLEQQDGIEIDSKPDFSPVEAAEERIVKTGAVISHGGSQAFYAPSTDRIQMPVRSSFDTEASYYATAFHELIHWSGAKDRLSRDLSGRFGNPEYAFEELVAEMGAAFLCQDHGIAGELRHAGYIKSWLKALRDDKTAVFKAAALAQKAADFINGLDATAEKLAA